MFEHRLWRAFKSRKQCSFEKIGWVDKRAPDIPGDSWSSSSSTESLCFYRSVNWCFYSFYLSIYIYWYTYRHLAIRTMKANIRSDVPLFHIPHKNFKYDVKALIDWQLQNSVIIWPQKSCNNWIKGHYKDIECQD